VAAIKKIAVGRLNEVIVFFPCWTRGPDWTLHAVGYGAGRAGHESSTLGRPRSWCSAKLHGTQMRSVTPRGACDPLRAWRGASPRVEPGLSQVGSQAWRAGQVGIDVHRHAGDFDGSPEVRRHRHDCLRRCGNPQPRCDLVVLLRAQQIEAEHLVDGLHAPSMPARAGIRTVQLLVAANRLSELNRSGLVSCPVLLSLTPVAGVESTT